METNTVYAIILALCLFWSGCVWLWVIKKYKNKGVEAFILDGYDNVPTYAAISLAAIPMGLIVLPFLVIRKCLTLIK